MRSGGLLQVDGAWLQERERRGVGVKDEGVLVGQADFKRLQVAQEEREFGVLLEDGVVLGSQLDRKSVV